MTQALFDLLMMMTHSSNLFLTVNVILNMASASTSNENGLGHREISSVLQLKLNETKPQIAMPNLIANIQPISNVNQY